MVREIKVKGKKAFECRECMMAYLDKSIAKKCEKWCTKHKSCNLEIIKFAVQNR